MNDNNRTCSICGGEGRPRAATCAPCASWWGYHNLQTAAEYGAYVGKVERAGTRIQKRGTKRRGLAVAR